MSDQLASNAANSAKPPRTFESIQGLRAIAALLVTLYHAASHYDEAHATFLVGNAGVDIFFVISGFVMWSIAARRAPSPQTFLLHRFIRLVPLYYIFTIALFVGFVLAPAAYPHMRPPTLQHLLLSLAFVPHFDPAGQMFPLLGQGWTLNFEMFFYLLFALALILPARWRLGSLIAALLTLPLLGLAVSQPQIHLMPPLVLLSPLLVEFLGGILIAQAVESGFRPKLVWCCASLLVGAAALALIKSPAGDDDWARLTHYGAPAFLIVAGAVGVEIGRRGFTVGRLPLLLGAASYSLYLTHSFVLSIVARLLPNWAPVWLYIVLATLSAAAVSVVVYWLLERPLMNWLRGGRRPASVAPVLPPEPAE